MTILIIGGTGTLGRQVVRELLNANYSVRCLVRNIRKANFLSEWGAELAYGDLKLPETIPNVLKGITTVLDLSTLRNEDELANLLEIDLIGKIALIKAAKVANVEGFIFFSIKENEKYQSIPLMQLKAKIEHTLQRSKIPYSIVQLSGFYQGLINQYAIPILEQETIFTTEDSKENGYINTQDIAKICVKILLTPNNFQQQKVGNIIEIDGPKLWTSNQILRVCEEIGGQKAKINFTPLSILSLIRKLTALSKWTWEIHDRLTFTEVLSNDSKNNVQSSVIDKKFKNNFETELYSSDMIALENYFQEYFENMLKKLKDLNYDQTKATKRKDLTF